MTGLLLGCFVLAIPAAIATPERPAHVFRGQFTAGQTFNIVATSDTANRFRLQYRTSGEFRDLGEGPQGPLCVLVLGGEFFGQYAVTLRCVAQESAVHAFAVEPLPDEIYVPTEGETEALVGSGKNNTLSLLNDDGSDKTALQKQEVLKAAEGAYVEGVIRFEMVSTPAPLVARRPRGP